MKKILLTGASGFLGEYLLEALGKQDVMIYAMSRQGRDSTSKKIKWITADISDETSIFRQELIDQLQDIDVIIHAAALYDLNASHEDMYRHNVIGTSNLLHLTRLIKNKPHFAQISTIAIAGDSTRNFDENAFDVGQRFPDPYASTKYAAENMVRTAVDIESRSVYRLGIVVGSSLDGRIVKIDGPYYMQRMIRSLKLVKILLGKVKFLPLPYNESTRLYLIPVNVASTVIASLLEKVEKRQGLTTFHVTGGGRGVSVRRALQAMLAHYDIHMNPIPMPQFLMHSAILKAVQIPPRSVEYMNACWTFSSKNLEKELPGFRYPSYAHFSGKMMDYADLHFFAKDKKK